MTREYKTRAYRNKLELDRKYLPLQITEDRIARKEAVKEHKKTKMTNNGLLMIKALTHSLRTLLEE